HSNTLNKLYKRVMSDNVTKTNHLDKEVIATKKSSRKLIKRMKKNENTSERIGNLLTKSRDVLNNNINMLTKDLERTKFISTIATEITPKIRIIKAEGNFFNFFQKLSHTEIPSNPAYPLEAVATEPLYQEVDEVLEDQELDKVLEVNTYESPVDAHNNPINPNLDLASYDNISNPNLDLASYDNISNSDLDLASYDNISISDLKVVSIETISNPEPDVNCKHKLSSSNLKTASFKEAGSNAGRKTSVYAGTLRGTPSNALFILKDWGKNLQHKIMDYFQTSLNLNQ
ncbi:MAG: hypothetical protein OXE99_00140, partial [Cellvibrionales bacterium]|nr:hypothetical protein [Cellvibrionales bacterium]